MQSFTKLQQAPMQPMPTNNPFSPNFQPLTLEQQEQQNYEAAIKASLKNIS